jgi:hypothetical protein
MRRGLLCAFEHWNRICHHPAKCVELGLVGRKPRALLDLRRDDLPRLLRLFQIRLHGGKIGGMLADLLRCNGEAIGHGRCCEGWLQDSAGGCASGGAVSSQRDHIGRDTQVGPDLGNPAQTPKQWREWCTQRSCSLPVVRRCLQIGASGGQIVSLDVGLNSRRCCDCTHHPASQKVATRAQDEHAKHDRADSDT